MADELNSSCLFVIDDDDDEDVDSSALPAGLSSTPRVAPRAPLGHTVLTASTPALHDISMASSLASTNLVDLTAEDEEDEAEDANESIPLALRLGVHVPWRDKEHKTAACASPILIADESEDEVPAVLSPHKPLTRMLHPETNDVLMIPSPPVKSAQAHVITSMHTSSPQSPKLPTGLRIHAHATTSTKASTQRPRPSAASTVTSAAAAVAQHQLKEMHEFVQQQVQQAQRQRHVEMQQFEASDERERQKEREKEKEKETQAQHADMSLVLHPELGKHFEQLQKEDTSHLQLVQGTCPFAPSLGATILFRTCPPTESQPRNRQLMIIVKGKDFLQLSQDGNIKHFARNIKQVVPDSIKTSLVIEGLEQEFRTRQNKCNRAWRQQVKQGEPAHMGIQPNEVSALRIQVEHVLIWLQLEAELFIRCTKHVQETAELALMYCKAITSAQNRMTSSLGLQPPQKSAKVDSKTFQGMVALWEQQLTCFPGVSPEKAHAIVQHYPSPAALLKGFETHGISAVAALVPVGQRQAVGPSIATRIFKFMMSQDPEEATM